jgi:hypothetical protein
VRDYGKVAPQFWTGATGKAIRDAGLEARVVATYLLTGPSANMTGLYYVALPTLAHEAGSSLQGALKALRSLRAIGFAYYDEATEHVWVPEMARFQIGDHLKAGDKRILGIIRELLAMKTICFVRDFLAKYADAYQLKTSPHWTSLASPLQAPSEPLPSQEQEQEQKQEQEQEQKKDKDSCARAERERVHNGFARFKALYPRRRQWGDAEKAWRRLEPNAVLEATILAAVELQRSSREWREDIAAHHGKHIPYPATWLNARGWEDELEVGKAPARTIRVVTREEIEAGLTGEKAIDGRPDQRPESAAERRSRPPTALRSS